MVTKIGERSRFSLGKTLIGESFRPCNTNRERAAGPPGGLSARFFILSANGVVLCHLFRRCTALNSSTAPAAWARRWTSEGAVPRDRGQGPADCGEAGAPRRKGCRRLGRGPQSLWRAAQGADGGGADGAVRGTMSACCFSPERVQETPGGNMGEARRPGPLGIEESGSMKQSGGSVPCFRFRFPHTSGARSRHCGASASGLRWFLRHPAGNISTQADQAVCGMVAVKVMTPSP